MAIELETRRREGARKTATLVISELYLSIQGESTYAGLPCVFVRLAGCPLRCSYCDTPYAFAGGYRHAVTDVVREVLAFGVPLVEITGGEPLAQPDCPQLAAALLDHGCTVLVETSGAFPINVLPAGTIRIMDLKCPSSGEADRNRWENLAHLTAKDEIKFVVGDRADYEWALAVVREHRLHERCAVLFSCVHNVLPHATLAAWLLVDRLPVRLQPQLHKFLWPDVGQGV